MSISFTASVSASAVAPAVAVNVRHLAAFRAFVRERGERGERGERFGSEGDTFLAYDFETRVCPWSLASIAALFDHDTGVIAVVEEAQFRGLNVRFWRDDAMGQVMMAVATSIDGSAAIDLSNDNAYAVLDALGIERDVCDRIAVSDLRSIVSDPEVRTRLHHDGLVRYADQLERLATIERSEDEVHVVWS